MLKSIVKKSLPPHWSGVAFDLVFVVLNLFLLPFLGRRIGGLFEQSFRNNERSFLLIALIILGVFFWRFAALYLKRIPVQRRRAEEGIGPVGWLWLLNLSAVLLSTALVIVLFLNILRAAGFGDFSRSENLIGAVGLVFPLIEIYLLYRLTKPLDKTEKERVLNQPKNPGAELFADLGLFAYLFVWQTFYNFYLAAITPNALRSVPIFIGVFIISLVVFVMFYIGPRSVFLIEDARYNSTRLTITLVFLTSFAAHIFL